ESNLDWEAQELAAKGLDFSAFQLKFKPEDEVVEKISGASVVVVNMVKMTESLLARLPECKLLIRHGIGYDNVDVPACTRHGIQFAYQPEYCTEDVAEHAITLLFAIARKVVLSRKTLEDASRTGQWNFSNVFPIYRMAGKTVGLLGVGRIGSLVVAKLKGFGFRIIGYDPYLSDLRKQALGIEFVDKETLFRSSDFITIHTPLNDETRQIVNARTLAMMKPTACLINTARGPMVDSEALAEVLKAGKIAGAAIDVYDVEPPPLSYPLFGLQNAILTPHIAWASEESGQDIRRLILEDILAFASGKTAKHVVNKELLKK
ncbi:MAG: C-terminal binding protein, partial [bacterium]